MSAVTLHFDAEGRIISIQIMAANEDEQAIIEQALASMGTLEGKTYDQSNPGDTHYGCLPAMPAAL
jgi:hypothetical protein